MRQVTLFSVPLFHPVAWTLVYEIQFYLMVAITPFVFGGRRSLGFVTLAISTCAILILQPYGILRHPLMIEFIFGVAVGAMYRWRSIAPFACTTIGALLLSAGMVHLSGKDLSVVNTGRILALAAPAAILIYGLMCLEREGKLSIPRALIKAGDESYSVYMWHYGIAVGLAPFLSAQGFGGIPQAVGYMVATVFIVAIVSRYSYRLFERPLMSGAFASRMQVPSTA